MDIYGYTMKVTILYPSKENDTTESMEETSADITENSEENAEKKGNKFLSMDL